MDRALKTSLTLALFVAASFANAESSTLDAQVFADEASTREHCAALAEGLLRGNEEEVVRSFQAAFDQVPQGLREEAAAMDEASKISGAAEQIASQLEEAALQRFTGTLRRMRRSPPIDHEIVRTDRLGRAFVRHVAIARFEKTGVRLDCVFYRGRNGWLLRPWMPVEESQSVFDSGTNPPAPQPLR